MGRSLPRTAYQATEACLGASLPSRRIGGSVTTYIKTYESYMADASGRRSLGGSGPFGDEPGDADTDLRQALAGLPKEGI